MAAEPRTFKPLDVMIVDSAETGGTLGESFGLLSHWYEFSSKMAKLVLSGLMLPAFVIFVAAWIVPVPAFVLSGWHVDLYLHRVLTILMIFFLPAGIIFCIVRYTPPRGLPRKIVDIISLRIPLLGGALYRLAISRYCRVFHMLSAAGLPITECAVKAGAATGNAVIANMFEPMADAVRAGKPASEGLSIKLPADFRGIWQVGEETGGLDDMAKKLADNYADSAEFRFKEFARWFPRVVYFIVMIAMVIAVFKGFQVIYGDLLNQTM